VRHLVESGAESMAVVGAGGELVGEFGTREVLAFAVPKFLGLLTDTSEVVNFEAFAKFFENETTTLVSEIMETEPVTVTPETGVMDAAHQLLESGRSRAYVTNPNRILLGDLSRLSLLRRVFAA
jgi:CBS domain-containing protein